MGNGGSGHRDRIAANHQYYYLRSRLVRSQCEISVVGSGSVCGCQGLFFARRPTVIALRAFVQTGRSAHLLTSCAMPPSSERANERAKDKGKKTRAELRGQTINTFQMGCTAGDEKKRLREICLQGWQGIMIFHSSTWRDEVEGKKNIRPELFTSTGHSRSVTSVSGTRVTSTKSMTEVGVLCLSLNLCPILSSFSVSPLNFFENRHQRDSGNLDVVVSLSGYFVTASHASAHSQVPQKRAVMAINRRM